MTSPSSQLQRVGWQLLKTTRPASCIFAATATLTGFYALDQFNSSTDSLIVIVVTSISIMATASVMMFNDYIDATHDLKKGKYFAFENKKLLFNTWKGVNCFTIIGLLYTINLDPSLGIFCGVVYGLGLGYSFSRKCFLVQNILVGICATAPLFFGSAYYGFSADSLLLPGTSIMLNILIGEIIKDQRDLEFDVGYKNTIPVIYSEAAAQTVVGFFATGSFILVLFWQLWALPAIAPLLLPMAFGFRLVHQIPSIIIERSADLSIALLLVSILTIG